MMIRKASHCKAVLRGLVGDLIQYEKVQTTHHRAQELSRYAQHLLHRAKSGHHRELYQVLRNAGQCKKVLEVLLPRYQNRTGGMVQVVRIGTRRGDRATLSLVRLIP